MKSRERLKVVSQNKISFRTANIYARKIDIQKTPVRFSSGHRGKKAIAERGYIVITKQWFPTKTNNKSKT